VLALAEHPESPVDGAEPLERVDPGRRVLEAGDVLERKESSSHPERPGIGRWRPPPGHPLLGAEEGSPDEERRVLEGDEHHPGPALDAVEGGAERDPVDLGEDVRPEPVEVVVALPAEGHRLAPGEHVGDVRPLADEQEERGGEAEQGDRQLDPGHPAAGAALELRDALGAGVLGTERRLARGHGPAPDLR